MGSLVTIREATPGPPVPAGTARPHTSVDAVGGAGLIRDRLLEPVLALSTTRSAGTAGRATPVIVVGPAGTGKTTLLTQLAARLRDRGQSVAWYTAEGFGLGADVVIESIGDVLARTVGATPGPVRTLHRLADLATGHHRAVTLIVDDAHLLTGPGAEVVTRLAELMPANFRLVLAGRREDPGWARLRLSGPVLRYDDTDLRFRTGEVRGWYEEHLNRSPEPDEVAQVARRSEGWIAGIQMFELSTAGWSTAERRRALTGRWDRLPLLRRYLVANVLHELPTDVRELLVRTSVFPVLTGPDCDALLGRSDSAAVLDDLVERNAFVSVSDPAAAAYRCHPLLRGFLRGELAHRLPAADRRAYHRRAGRLLERAGLREQALRAYLRAGDTWSGNVLAGPDPVPRSRADATAGDRWSTLARARSHLCAGELTAAVDWYRRAEVALAQDEERNEVRDEGGLVAGWLDNCPVDPASPHWSGQLRAALGAHPARVTRVAAGRTGNGWVLTAAVAALLAGDPAAAAGHCAGLVAGEDRDPAGVLGEALRLVLTVRHTPAAGPVPAHGRPPALVRLDALLADGDLAAVPWLAGTLRSLRAVWGVPDQLAWAEGVAADRRARGDRWGALVAGAAVAFGRWRLATGDRPADPGGGDGAAAEAVGALRRCAEDAAGLGAGTVEAWARAGLAVLAGAAGDPEAARLVAEARDLTAVAQVPVLAALLDEQTDLLRSTVHRAVPPAVRALAGPATGRLRTSPAADDGTPRRPAGTVTPPDPVDGTAATPEPGEQSAGPTVTVRCFGRFDLASSAQPVLWATLRPRARSLLGLLTVRDGRRVHVETLYGHLWPDLPPEAARRNLHVAISSIRGVLTPLAPAPGRSILRREAETYVLALPERTDHDLRRFTSALARWRQIRSTATPQAVAVILREGLGVYTGDLLPEEGQAEWIGEEREFVRQAAVDASVALATAELAMGQCAVAVETCRRGLRMDRLHDPMWRLLTEAYRRSGDLAAADRAAAGYRSVLADLGVPE